MRACSFSTYATKITILSHILEQTETARTRKNARARAKLHHSAQNADFCLFLTKFAKKYKKICVCQKIIVLLQPKVA